MKSIIALDSENGFRYLEAGIKAEDHSPIYKMHKYFARRPHNVFQYLIEWYTKKGDIVLDPFCGGGVTLVEGLLTHRKVIAVDINPLATFISNAQTTKINLGDYGQVMDKVWEAINPLVTKYYTTSCRICGKPAPVRWFELAYFARCGVCNNKSILSNDNKLTVEEKQVNGVYICTHCGSSIKAVDAPRDGYELLTVTYRCSCNPDRQTAVASLEDKALMAVFEEDFDSLISEYGLWYPEDIIPEDWDRQKEDCLFRKSILRFSDLFTKRNLFFNAYLLKLIQRYRHEVTPELYQLLLFTFSAVIRHTNNMTISTGNWMDGRPVSWAKHAYWIPNQFVEVNPIEYIEKRWNAIVSGLNYQKETFPSVRRVDSFPELIQNDATHIIWTKSSVNLSIPDESIDAIITDPPYGSNVQYGELSQFWLVWLKDELSLSPLFSLEDEILVQRKNQSSGGKDYEFYAEGMLQVFQEGYRVLKPGKPLVFTFNNKDMRAWFAVIKAATQAGFYLDPKGVIYQEPIENYKNTAHLRYAGSLHGDFIYTFIKPAKNYRQNGLMPTNSSKDVIEKVILQAVESFLFENGQATISELYIHILPRLIPVMVKSAANDEDFAKFKTLLDNNLETLFEKNFHQDNNSKEWRLIDPSKIAVKNSGQLSRNSPEHSGEKVTCDYSPSYGNSELAQKINDLESSFDIFDEEPLFENLVNMSLSSNEPYHRWARYREGYSGQLVKELIHRDGIKHKEQFVFDPMCGSGSTLVAASQLGFDSLGTDVNPYSIDLTNAKVLHYSPTFIEKVKAFISEPKSSLPQISFELWQKANTIEKYFQKPNLEVLLSILGNIETLKDPLIVQFLKIAWLAILEDCSERKKDGNGLATRPAPTSDVWSRFLVQVKMQIEDLEKNPLSKEVKAQAVCETAFEAATVIEQFTKKIGKKLGCIIFSPPYANSFDYFESYKLELLFGGYFDEQTLVAARERTIRNYRKGYGYQLQTTNQLVSMLADEVRLRIPQKETKTGKTDNRSRLVPNLLAGYFDDMTKVIASFYKAMPSGSTCHIVVDQSSYLGVVIPTDLLLADIAQQQGLVVDRLIRCRRANTSGQQLNEYPYLKSILRECIVSVTKT